MAAPQHPSARYAAPVKAGWLLSPDAPLVTMAFILPVLSILGGRLIAYAFIPIAVWHIFRNIRHFGSCALFLRHPLFLLLGGAVAWGWVSVLWTIAPESAISALMRVGSLILAGMLMLYLIFRRPPSAEAIAQAGTALVAGMVIAAACSLSAIFLEGGVPAYLNRHLSTGRPFDMDSLKQGNLVLSILVWPLVILLHARGKSFAAHALLLIWIIILALMPSDTAFCSLLLSAVAYGLLRLLSNRMRLLTTVAAFACIWISIVVFLPSVTVTRIQDAVPATKLSMLHRLYIWQFSLSKIEERPIFGWGLKSSKFIPGADDFIYHRRKTNLTLLPLHPHNNMLQSWLELGIPGLLFYLGLIGYALSRCYRFSEKLPPGISAACYAAVFTSLLGGMTGFGLWQSWWINANMMNIALLFTFLSPLLITRQSTR